MKNMVSVVTPPHLEKIDRMIQIPGCKVSCKSDSLLYITRRVLMKDAKLKCIGLYGLQCYAPKPVHVDSMVHFQVDTARNFTLEGYGEIVMVKKTGFVYLTELKFDLLERKTLNVLRKALFQSAQPEPFRLT